MNRLSDKVLTLDEAIEHAEECADNTPCGQNHKQLAEWLKELDRLKTTPIGNIYALRQALVKAHTMLKVCDWPEGVDMQGVADLMKEIESAIDAPARNCDVGTAEEQGERFKNFCRNHQFISSDSEDGFPPVYVCSNESCPLHDYYIAHGEDNCELAWAQMPYEEGGAK